MHWTKGACTNRPSTSRLLGGLHMIYLANFRLHKWQEPQPGIQRALLVTGQARASHRTKHRFVNRVPQEWRVNPVSVRVVRLGAPCDFTSPISSGNRPPAVRQWRYTPYEWKSKGARLICKIRGYGKQLGLKIIRAHVNLWKPL